MTRRSDQVQQPAARRGGGDKSAGSIERHASTIRRSGLVGDGRVLSFAAWLDGLEGIRVGDSAGRGGRRRRWPSPELDPQPPASCGGEDPRDGVVDQQLEGRGGETPVAGDVVVGGGA